MPETRIWGQIYFFIRLLPSSELGDGLGTNETLGSQSGRLNLKLLRK